MFKSRDNIQQSSLQLTGKICVLLILGFLIILFTWPLKILFCLTLLHLILKENFPFSHYPMYAGLSSRVYYLLITNENDEMLGLKREFGLSADFLKRVYDHEIKSLAKAKGCKKKQLTQEDLNMVGMSLLEALEGYARLKNSTLTFKRLKLYIVSLSLIDCRIDKEQKLIAET